VDQVQPPQSKAILDGVRPDSRRKQLLPHHNPVLTVRQFADQTVDTTPVISTKDAFTRYIGVDASFVGHGGQVGGRVRAGGARTWRVRDEGATKEAPVRRYRLWL
jgi:hypothetical protein